MTMHSEKLGMSVQDKLTKQNEMNRQMLVRELSKLEGMRKSDVRMIETAKQRFRSRYKKLGIRANFSSSEAIDIRMYETHNPGFCYHFTGTIKESGPRSLKTTRRDSIDSYEVVRGMLFTDGEVDIDKVLCLHLLAAHTMSENIETQVCSMGTSFSDKANKGKPFSGAWNNILPCYVLEHHRDDLTESSSKENHHKLIIENETLANFQLSYERYVKENADMVSALTANDRSTIMAPWNLGRMPIISPHVYSLLGASHELRVKQAIAEGNSSKRYNNNKRSNITDTESNDVKSITDFFQSLEPESIELKSRINNDESKKNSTENTDLSKIYSLTKNFSKKSVTGSNNKLDRSITMLKGKSKKPVEELIKTWRTNETIDNDETNDLVTIKSSHRKIINASKTSSTKSAFKVSRDRSHSINSIDSFIDRNSRYFEKKNRKYIYLDRSVKNVYLGNREYKIVGILVNYQLQALVHSVIEILQQVNSSKVERIIEIAKDRKKIGEIFEKSVIKKFLETLVDQPIVSSPKSFVLSTAIAIDEFDAKLESFHTDLIATMLGLPDCRSFAILVDEIRDNIFFDGKNRVSVINESSTIDMPIDGRNKREESTMFLDNQRNEMPIAVDEETIDDRELSMKCKTMKIIAANKSSEGIRTIESDKVEGKLGDENFNRIINNSMSTDDFNDTSVTKIVKSSGAEKYHFKGQKMIQEGYLDPDRVILRRMTNEQRILVGRLCAALKTKKINNEGLIKERTPLAALITPVLSRESIKILTRGTSYSKSGVMKKHEEEDEKEEQTVARSDSLTGPVLAKVRRDIAEHETKRRLESFFAM